MENKPNHTDTTANDIGNRFKEIVEQGNSRRVVVRKADGNTLLDVSLTVAIIAVFVLLVFIPWGMFFGFIAVIAGIAMRIQVEVLRVIDEKDEVIEITREEKV